MFTIPPHVYRINVKPETPGERGLPKIPVPSAKVTFQGVEGDFNRHRYQINDDGYDPADRAVLLLPLETLDELNTKGDWKIEPGDLGENITTQGIAYNEFAPGKVLRVGGNAVLRIYQQATPCGNLKRLDYINKEGDPKNYDTFKEVLKGHRGWYARVLVEGTVFDRSDIEIFPGFPLEKLEQKIKKVEGVVQEWVDEQGHDRCWYYPELFTQLVDILDIKPAKDPSLPPLDEFRKGCERFQKEEYGKSARDDVPEGT